MTLCEHRVTMIAHPDAISGDWRCSIPVHLEMTGSGAAGQTTRCAKFVRVWRLIDVGIAVIETSL